MSKKKVNPRRIPLAKKYVDREAILTEVVEGKLDDAWILASNALYDEGYKDLDGICDAVSAFLNSDAYTKANSEELKQATAISGIQEPVVHTRLENIKSQYELDAYKKKMNQSALFTSLVSICLALMKTGQFSEEVLRRVFFNVDLSLAEVESGRTSIKEIERNLDKRMAADAIRK